MNKKVTLEQTIELLEKLVFASLNEDLYINPILLDEINHTLSLYYDEKVLSVDSLFEDVADITKPEELVKTE